MCRPLAHSCTRRSPSYPIFHHQPAWHAKIHGTIMGPYGSPSVFKIFPLSPKNFTSDPSPNVARRIAPVAPGCSVAPAQPAEQRCSHPPGQWPRAPSDRQTEPPLGHKTWGAIGGLKVPKHIPGLSILSTKTKSNQHPSLGYIQETLSHMSSYIIIYIIIYYHISSYIMNIFFF